MLGNKCDASRISACFGWNLISLLLVSRLNRTLARIMLMNSPSQSAPIQSINTSKLSNRTSSIIRVVIASLFGIIFMQVLTPIVAPSILLYGLLFVTYIVIGLGLSKYRCKR